MCTCTACYSTFQLLVLLASSVRSCTKFHTVFALHPPFLGTLAMHQIRFVVSWIAVQWQCWWVFSCNQFYCVFQHHCQWLCQNWATVRLHNIGWLMHQAYQYTCWRAQYRLSQQDPFVPLFACPTLLFRVTFTECFRRDWWQTIQARDVSSALVVVSGLMYFI